MSVAYIGPKSRTETPRKTKIGTEVTHVTRDSDIAFKVKRSKVSLHGAGAYCGGLPHSLFATDVENLCREKTTFASRQRHAADSVDQVRVVRT